MSPTWKSPSECSTGTSNSTRPQNSSLVCPLWPTSPISAYTSHSPSCPGSKPPRMLCSPSLPPSPHQSQVLSILSPQYLLHSLPLLLPPFHGPGLHFWRPVLGLFVTKQYSLLTASPMAFTSTLLPHQQTPLIMIETENPVAYFPRLLCSQAWPRDLVLANQVAGEE